MALDEVRQPALDEPPLDLGEPVVPHHAVRPYPVLPIRVFAADRVLPAGGPRTEHSDAREGGWHSVQLVGVASGRGDRHVGLWRASWSPKRSPTAGSIACAPPATRSTCALGLSPDELLDVVVGAHALIIRSATNVTDEVLAAGSDLLVVGRAGIGLDNVDVEAATRRGVMVVNAPQSNIVSAAEHTMALLLAQARNVPQAHAALVAGRWERSRWEGVELADKTLGIVGLGRIGKLVADRATGFGMRLIAYDPFVSADRARQIGVELLPLDQVVAESDFLTIHLPKTAETTGLIGRDLLLKAKPTLRVINVARGGIVDEAALADAIRDGVIAGAALDVFDTEPTTESPLFELDTVVVTPHLGASTREAQDKAGDTIADMVAAGPRRRVRAVRRQRRRRRGERDAAPVPAARRAARAACSPRSSASLPAARRDHASRATSAATTRASSDWPCSRASSAAISDEPVTYVNAPQLAKEHGVDVREVSSTTLGRLRQPDHASRGGGHSLSRHAGGRAAASSASCIIDGHTFDVPPADHMLMVTNDDRPGVIGTVGTLLGNAGVNIADMDVGRAEEAGTAVDADRPDVTGRPADARCAARRARHHQRHRPAGLSASPIRVSAAGRLRGRHSVGRNARMERQRAARQGSRVRRATARAAVGEVVAGEA